MHNNIYVVSSVEIFHKFSEWYQHLISSDLREKLQKFATKEDKHR